MKKKGISLIVLVITIVVIIILAAAVILSLGKNNPINSAKEAKIKTTIDNFKSDLVMSVSKITTNTLGQVAVTDIDAPGNYEVTELVPSIKGTEYENELVVIDGKLQIKQNSSLSSETQLEINNIIGQRLTANVVKSNPNTYYGKTIDFKDGQNLNSWEVFYADNTNIYLIAKKYVTRDSLNKNTNGTVFESKSVASGLNLELLINANEEDTRESWIAKLSNEANFSHFKDADGKAASVVGGPTIEQYVTYYNSISHASDKTQYIGCVLNSAKDGYNIKSDGEPSAANYNAWNIDTIHLKGAHGYWLLSKSAEANNKMLRIDVNKSVTSYNYDNGDLALRLVVKLNSNVALVDAGNGTFNLE